MKEIHSILHTVSVVLYLANEVIVLITVEAGMVSDAAAAIKNVDGIKKIYIVTGPFDIVVIAEIPERSKFRALVDSIHEAPGINRTETCIAI